METTIKRYLQIITEWSRQWLVQFNANKARVLFFSLCSDPRPNLIINNINLDFVDNQKQLDVTFSSNGKWHEHVDNIIKSSSKVLGSIRELKFKLRRAIFNQIYISYLRSTLEYASVVWDGCTKI